MGMEPDPLWDDVQAHLTPLPVQDSIYQVSMSRFGFFPITDDLDQDIMENTIEQAVGRLKTNHCSWHYPVTAMAAARIGRPGLAIETLLFPGESNGVSPSGYNYWCSIVPIYLPGNGSLLSAVAMMAAGWDGAPDRNAPGFPDNGQWVVKWEGLRTLP